ncbi:MAG: phosphate acyltransferase PlsX [Pseudomonadota bacterium]
MTPGTVISVDGMGGDGGPAPIIAGLNRAAKVNPSLRFLIHGDTDTLSQLLRKRRRLRDCVEIVHAKTVVAMDEKPSRALRNGRDSSLWSALQAVSEGRARVALSAGNTGAIVALSMAALRRAPGVHRPAIAVHWPSNRDEAYNVVLDMGADIKADARNLTQFAAMGAEYARLAFSHARPRVGLLNVGSEEMKGRPELHEASDMLTALGKDGDLGFEFIGYVEGTDILSDRVEVIVTDGFTGNISMKAAEGTAAFIRRSLKDAFQHSLWSRIGALFALTSLRRLRMRIDPRRVNGGVFLGLNGGVVKSHGSADAVGHAAAVMLAAKMATDDFPARVAARLAKLDVERLSEGPNTAGGAHGR